MITASETVPTPAGPQVTGQEQLTQPEVSHATISIRFGGAADNAADNQVTHQLLETYASNKKRGSSSQGSFQQVEKVLTLVTKFIEAFASLMRARNESQKLSSIGPTPTPSSRVSTGTNNLPIYSSSDDRASFNDEVSTMPDALNNQIATADAPESLSAMPPGSIIESSIALGVSPPSSARQPVNLGSQMQKTSGFLWKPVSDKDGRLAVLLPPHMTGRVAAVAIIAPDGSRTLQSGRSSGVGNGDREHFRFSKPGGQFPDGSIVLVKMKDGSRHHISIRETSRRVAK